MKHTLVILAGLLLAPPAVSMAGEPAATKRTWQGIPGLERTPKGRLFVSWFSGGPTEPAPQNTVYLCRSDDRGKTFTEPVPMAGPIGTGRAFDPTLWRDPTGRLWYIFNRGNKQTAEHGVYARTCADPDGVQADDGLIWIVYDHSRQGAGEILLATFRENDVIAGKNVSGDVRLKHVVNKLDKAVSAR